MSDEGKRWTLGPGAQGTEGIVELIVKSGPFSEEVIAVVPATDLDRPEAERDAEREAWAGAVAKVNDLRKAAEARADEADRTSKGLAHDLARAEARVRELEGALQRVRFCYSQGVAPGSDWSVVAGFMDALAKNALNLPAEDVQHWPDEGLETPPPKRVRAFKARIRPADEERHKDG